MFESKSSRAMRPFYLIRNAARRNKVLSNLSPAAPVSPECTSQPADGAFHHLGIEPATWPSSR
ncbi:hypothetical protein NZK35_20155 [Stieleria sp. ICT_E10.1]|uniref:hypothetical protein n=1 Tax=Stieleria sedimenti TaxID=2976331 RepID=UPI00218018CD|nr:hypothetical protein [Stieleria sedimenti]MCS7468973.1 hypothetical protein [Stieleria sedimenti]